MTPKRIRVACGETVIESRFRCNVIRRSTLIIPQSDSQSSSRARRSENRSKPHPPCINPGARLLTVCFLALTERRSGAQPRFNGAVLRLKAL